MRDVVPGSWRSWLPLLIPLTWGLGCGQANLVATELRPTEGAAPVGGAGGGPQTGAGATTGLPVTRTMTVRGRFLYDVCGEPVLLRGASEMITYTNSQSGVPEFTNIAQTGANAVRIVWRSSDSPERLDNALTNAQAASLIPVVELHDGQGDFAKLPTLVAYWTRPDVVAVLQRHQQSLLVSFGSGVGATVAQADWEAGYRDALARVRAASLEMPFVVEAPSSGRDIARLQASGPAILQADPAHNVMLAVGIWWPDATRARITTELERMVALSLPFMVSEFSSTSTDTCPGAAIDYRAILELTEAQQVGWFAWSWGAVVNAGDCHAAFDMTTDGTVSTLKSWGLEVAITDPNSIARTSLRPRFVTTGTCSR